MRIRDAVFVQRDAQTGEVEAVEDAVERIGGTRVVSEFVDASALAELSVGDL